MSVVGEVDESREVGDGIVEYGIMKRESGVYDMSEHLLYDDLLFAGMTFSSSFIKSICKDEYNIDDDLLAAAMSDQRGFVHDKYISNLDNYTAL